MNDRIHLLEMTIIRLAETTSKLKKQIDILSANQNKIIDSISPPKETDNEVDEAESTGV
tara:strand:+ start:3718 stop:3894 length:177 start_codon:yes stop_codon:yes gene_type:complete